MNNTIKKITTAVLLLLVFVPSLFIVIFHFQQQAIRQRMREKLEEKLLQTISIPASGFHWVEAGQEILIKGQMFDIKSFKLEDGIYTFTGLFDSEETGLIQELNDWKNLNEGYADNTLSDLFELLLTVFKSEQNENLECVSTLQHIDSDLFLQLPNRFMAVLTPPPQGIS